MSRRAWIIVAILLAADALALGLTIHTHLTWRPSPGGPAAMSLGQVVGWLVSFGLLVVTAFIALAARESAKNRGGK